MPNDPFHYGFQPQPVQPAEPERTYFGRPAPEPEPIPQKVYPPGTLVCDFCKEAIRPGEEALGCLYGRGGVSQQSGRQMVLPADDIRNGEFDVHFNCLPNFLLDNLPEIVDQLLSIRSEYGYDDDPIEGEEQTERFCDNCDAKLDE